ncbi:MAG: hypothetical protein LBM00_11700 [Deltaproteobacteria bacterium]|jgi:hypothetical protein|nr:hypothetical protein [Deltaproteobacteria bacterium]
MQIKDFIKRLIRRYLRPILLCALREEFNKLDELGTLCSMQEKLNKLNKLDTLCAMQEKSHKDISSYFNAVLSNQLALSAATEGNIIIHTPWYARKFFYLDKYKGSLCFGRTTTSEKKDKIFILSIPKSGTYFLGLIFNKLGFERSPIHGGSGGYGDWRGLSTEERAETSGKYSVIMPYTTQYQLVMPGQYLMSHIHDEKSIDFLRQNFDKVLFSIRDLRSVFISHLRHLLFLPNKKILGQAIDETYCTTEQLQKYFLTPPGDFSIIVQAAILTSKIINEKSVNVVRYEELVSHDRDKMSNSLKAISKVSGCLQEEVFQAVENSEGQETWTFFNEHSNPHKIWDDTIENLFKKHGLDVLNEKLGYSREYVEVSCTQHRI